MHVCLLCCIQNKELVGMQTGDACTQNEKWMQVSYKNASYNAACQAHKAKYSCHGDAEGVLLAVQLNAQGMEDVVAAVLTGSQHVYVMNLMTAMFLSELAM